MRIAFIVNQFPMLSETFVLNQATGLLDAGHEVDIYTTHSADPANLEKMHPDVETYGMLNRVTYARTPPINQIWRILLGLWLIITHVYKSPRAVLQSLNGFRYGWQAIALKLLYAVTPILGNGPYDIIHCQFATLTTVGAIARAHAGTTKARLIVSCRGYDVSAYLRQIKPKTQRQLFAAGDLFLPNCDFFKQRLLSLGCPPEKIIVLRSGIDCDRFHFTPRHLPEGEPVRIVTTGRLVDKKGIEYGIRAIALLNNISHPVEYSIIGDGPLKQQLQSLIQALNLEHIVKLRGWMQQQELIQVLDQSHLFLAPNITAADGNQDAPINTIKEALAMGLPIIGTRHGGIPEVVEDSVSGFLVPEKDVEGLAEKLRYMINQSSKWHAMGDAGRRFVTEHYNIKTLNDRLLHIYSLGQIA